MIQVLKVATDGGVRPAHKLAACAVINLEDETTLVSALLPPDTTSNQAEYHGLLCALDYAIEHDVQDLIVQTDSELMAKHIDGSYKCRDFKLQELLREVKQKIQKLRCVLVLPVKRDRNEIADRVVNHVMDTGQCSLIIQ